MNTPYDKIISKLFKDRWTEDLANADISKQQEQLYKTLHNQYDGFWSGHTAYHLAVDGGFLIDSKSGNPKELTAVGFDFMECINPNWKESLKRRAEQ